MESRQKVLRYIAHGARGIEVAPWHTPIIRPGGDREVITLDVFDRATLLTRAAVHPDLDKAAIERIGEVDLVGSACEIAELASARFGADARFDFVISSHNLEHLPDSVRFLRGCEAVLRVGGMVAMAVPDKRACFDFFRPHSSTGEMLQAFHEQRERPSFAQTFSEAAYAARLRVRDGVIGAFTIHENPSQIALAGDLTQAYATWRDQLATGDTQYHDTHCWTFTPSSLELILIELTLLGLINFEIVEVTEPGGTEFFVHLRKRPPGAPVPAGLAERREVLLQQTIDELARTSRFAWHARGVPARWWKSVWRDTIRGRNSLGRLLRRIRQFMRQRYGSRTTMSG